MNGSGYNIGDTMAIWQMNTMLGTCNTEGGGGGGGVYTAYNKHDKLYDKGI